MIRLWIILAAVLGFFPDLAASQVSGSLYFHCPVTRFNGEPWVDIAAVNPTAKGGQFALVDPTGANLLVLTPNNRGSFFDLGACDQALSGTPTPVAVSRPLAVIAAPLGSEDSDIDLTVLGSNGVLPLFSDGAGGFMAPVLPVPPTPTPAPQFTPFPAGNGPQDLTNADFDGDDIEDVAVATNAGNSIEVIFGDTDGTFDDSKTNDGALANRITIQDDAPLIAVRTDDFDGDARPDIAAISNLSASVRIFLRETDGSCAENSQCSCTPDDAICFKPAILAPIDPATTPPGPIAFAVGRFNNDGAPDLGVLADDGRLRILVASTTAPLSFSVRQSLDTFGTPRALAVGRFNDDLFDDVAVAVSNSSLCPTAIPTPVQTPIPTTEPGGEPTATPTPTRIPDSGNHCVQFFTSDQTGSLTPAGVLRVGADPRVLIVAQLDSDLRVDLLSLNDDGQEGLTAFLSGNPAATPTPTVTNTPEDSGTPTQTLTPAPSETLTAEPTLTPVPTNTCPPMAVCVQGEGCVTIVPPGEARLPWPLLGLAAFLFRWRRR